MHKTTDGGFAAAGDAAAGKAGRLITRCRVIPGDHFFELDRLRAPASAKLKGGEYIKLVLSSIINHNEREALMRVLIALISAAGLSLAAAAITGFDNEHADSQTSKLVTVVGSMEAPATRAVAPIMTYSNDFSQDFAASSVAGGGLSSLLSVSQSIQHVPEHPIRFQNLTKYVPHDTRYPFKTAWGECVTLSASQNQNLEARCEIRLFKLVEFNSNRPPKSDPGLVVGDAAFLLQDQGTRASIRCELTKKSKDSYTYGAPCYGANFYRATCTGSSCQTEWYKDTDPTDGNAGSFFPGDNMIVFNGVLKINAARHPDRVAHWWTEDNDNPPTFRTSSRPGKHYLVEIEFRTIGKAALRIGLDRWTGGKTHVGECNWAGTSGEQQNCEDYNSDWYQTLRGWTRVRLPLF